MKSTEFLYEELRKATDGGSESMTHDDALKQISYWRDAVIELTTLKNQEPAYWTSVQVATWIGNQLMHNPSMFERGEVCKYVRSLGRHPTLQKHLAPGAQPKGES